MTTNFRRRCPCADASCDSGRLGRAVTQRLGAQACLAIGLDDRKAQRSGVGGVRLSSAGISAFPIHGSGQLRERSAFALAYVGLPVLYAAFNTFEPLHDWILSGLLFVSGGTVGSPFDPTDSVVIPLGLALAGWVWHKSQTDSGRLRAQFHLLIAIVASYATVATSGCPVSPTAWHVGTRSDGVMVVAGHYIGTNTPNQYSHHSYDGGLTWEKWASEQQSPIERDQTVAWGGAEVNTPRGIYAIEGSSIVLKRPSAEGLEVHDTSYVERGSNMWAQEYGAKGLRDGLTCMYDDADTLLTRVPLNVDYHDSTGNVLVGMGLQGVLVGTPDGEWHRFAVGDYAPTDFSFLGKARLAFSTYFWITTLAISLCLVTAALLFSPRTRYGSPSAEQLHAALRY